MADGPQIFDFDPRYRPQPRISTPAFNPNAGSALDYLNNPPGPARPVPTALPPAPSLAPPPSLGLPPEDLPQQPPDPYGQSMESLRTTMETPPTAVPGQPPWWKQILGYAAESFRPTSGMGIGDRLFGVAGAKREAAARTGRLEEQAGLAELEGERAAYKLDVSEHELKGKQEERLTRGPGTWVEVDKDENDTKKYSIFTTASDGTRLGKQRTPAETKYTVSAEFAAKHHFIDPDTGRPPTEPVEIGEDLYLKWTGPLAKPLAPVAMGRSMVSPIQGESGQVTGYGPPLPGFDLPPDRNIYAGPGGTRLEAMPGDEPGTDLTQISKDPVSSSAELGAAARASNTRLIENDYNKALVTADDNFIANMLVLEGQGLSGEAFRDQVELIENFWKEATRKAENNRVDSHRSVLNMTAPTREPPTMPGNVPEADFPALPELPSPSPPTASDLERIQRDVQAKYPKLPLPQLEAPPAEQTPTELGRQLKQQYPGEYDDWSDEELGQRYLNKQRSGNAQ